MTSYIIRRLLLLPLIVFGVTLLIFGMLTQLTATQRVSLYVRDVPKKQDDVNRLIDKYGLDDPVHIQYGRWVTKLVLGHRAQLLFEEFEDEKDSSRLGFSKTGKEPVGDVIKNHFPATVELALWAFLPIMILGIQLGILAALQHNKAVDHILRILSIIGTSTPSFVAGLLLLMFLAVRVHWFPTSDRLDPLYQRVVDSEEWLHVTGLYTIDSIVNGRLDVLANALHHLFLPVVTLAYISLAVLVRVTRSSMLETLRQDYVRTARAKGLKEGAVIQKHARPNAMLPVVTIGGAILVGLLNGVLITETIFHWPGMGRRYLEAAQNLDIVTVLGLTMFSSVLLILGNLVVDFLYAYLDPRVRLN